MSELPEDKAMMLRATEIQPSDTLVTNACPCGKEYRVMVNFSLVKKLYRTCPCGGITVFWNHARDGLIIEDGVPNTRTF